MDGLRGVAVLLVFLYHEQETLGVHLHASVGGLIRSISSLARAGFLGVEVFFFISGFVLFYPYARALFEHTPLQGLTHFANRRALKILPSYVASLTFMTAVLLITLPRPIRSSTGLSLLANYALHLAFLHSVSEKTFFAINGPLWSLAVEVQFYVLFPFLAWAFCRWPLATPAIMVALSSAYRLYLQIHGLAQDSFYVYQLPGVLDLFAFGMISSYLAVMLRSRCQHLDRFRTIFTVTSIAAAGALGAILVHVSRLSPGAPSWTWQNTNRTSLGILLALFAISAIFGAPRWQQLLANRALIYLGFISYNLYLWNKFVIVLFADHILPTLPNWPHHDLIVAVLSVICCTFVAILATYVIEQPFLNHGWGALHSLRSNRVPESSRGDSRASGGQNVKLDGSCDLNIDSGVAAQSPDGGALRPKPQPHVVSVYQGPEA